MIPWDLAKHLSPRTRMMLEARLMCALTKPGQILLAALLTLELITKPDEVTDKLLTFYEGFPALRVETESGFRGGE